MAPLFTTDSAARIAFYLLIAAFVLLEWRVRLRSHLNRDGIHGDRVSFLVVNISVAAGLAAGFVLASSAQGAAIDFGRWPIFVAGLVLMVAGIALRQWSVLTLGRLFTTDVRVFSGQEVVDRGPYRWVAHPSYSGLLVTLCGVGLALGNWPALATVVLVPGLGLLVRIRYEERTLTASLGEPYRRFLADRARLFPGLW